jgi:hypothetical protein
MSSIRSTIRHDPILLPTVRKILASSFLNAQVMNQVEMTVSKIVRAIAVETVVVGEATPHHLEGFADPIMKFLPLPHGLCKDLYWNFGDDHRAADLWRSISEYVEDILSAAIVDP